MTNMPREPSSPFDHLKTAFVQKNRLNHLTLNSLFVLVSIFFGLAQFRFITIILQAGFVHSAEASKGVVKGLPHWELYQSRVLGPYTVEALSVLFRDYLDAHRFYSVFMISVSGFLVLFLSRRLYGTKCSVASFFIFQFFFAFLLNRPWLYSWDYYGFIIFSLFVFLVLTTREWYWFTALFAIAVFNRESALFIAFWTFLDPIFRFVSDRYFSSERAPFEWRLCVSGLICMPVGVAVITFLRKHLLIREVGPELFNIDPPGSGFFQYHLIENLDAIRRSFEGFHAGIPFLYPIFYLTLLILLVLLTLKDWRRLAALSAVYFLMLISILSIGIFFETRLYIEMLPIVVFLLWELIPSRTSPDL